MARNLVVSSLPAIDAAGLQADLVTIRAGTLLADRHAPLRIALLPETCVISAVITMRDGRWLSAAIFGYEGVLAPCVQGGVFGDEISIEAVVGGTLWRVAFDAWEQVMTGDTAHAALRRSHGIWLSQDLQLNVCARAHALQARTATMLLLLADKVGTAELTITHDALASLLGVQRPSVSLTMERYTSEGLVSNGHGRVVLTDPPALQAHACECFESMMRRQRDLVAPVRVV